ncbi:MAG: thiamine pyrophosphate-binding protein [Candidatus Peribacter sp.]|nr:thiamine pyrophosphate-binding protein [Candidatus Peribacter sp.]
MKASALIADFLRRKEVPCVFEVVGGMIAHILDSLHAIQIPIVSMHHEQSTAFAADAVGRMTGKPGIAMATSGPGATNLLTGIGSCFFDSSPAIFITGQVNRHELKGDRPVRQVGFQETDIVSMAVPVTKAAWQVREPDDLLPSLERAYAIAMEGRPGPVLLDIPLDIQSGDIPFSPLPSEASSPDTCAVPALDGLLQALAAAARPLILVGSGVRTAMAADALTRFAERAHVPVVHSLLGLDVLPSDHPLSVGMIGTYGNRWANLAVGRSDCVIVIGSRLDIRQTGADTVAWKGERTVIHIDCDVGEINHRIRGCIPIVADIADILPHILNALPDSSDRYQSWRKEIGELRDRWPDTSELKDVRGINPNVFMHALSSQSGAAAAYVTDVGLHQMWAAQSVERKQGQRFLTPGGMGAMGYALPAAIGVACVTRPHPVVVIAGDGGFQLNIQELQTVVRNHLPIKIIIMHNDSYGMVRQFQDSYFEGRYQSTVWGYSAPDFTRIASAYGIAARTVVESGEVPDAVRWLWQEPTEPCLLQVMVDQSLNAYPKIAFGRPMTDMEPHVNPVGMNEKT